MADSVTVKARAPIAITQVIDGGFLDGRPLPIARTLLADFATSGALADQCDGVYAATLSFAASTPQALDVRNLLDVRGQALTLARARLVFVRVLSTTDGARLTLSTGATDGWTGLLGAGSALPVLASTAGNGGGLLLTAPNTTGYPTGVANKVLTLTPSAHAFDAEIIIAGCKS